MTAFLDLTGKRFGRWTVQGLWGDEPSPAKYWRCVCDCGNEKSVLGDNLRARKIAKLRLFGLRKCGRCATTHGMVDHPAYNSWKAAKRRCDNEDSEEYSKYGARGIKVCEPLARRSKRSGKIWARHGTKGSASSGWTLTGIMSLGTFVGQRRWSRRTIVVAMSPRSTRRKDQ